MFLKLDGTFVVQLINFVIFFALLNVVFMRPVSKAIVERRRYINSVVNDYDRYQAEASACRTQAEAIRAAARREAEVHMGRSRAETSNETAALASEFHAQALDEVERAQRTAASELDEARKRQDALADEIGELMLNRALGEHA